MDNETAAKLVDAIDRLTAAVTENGEFLAGIREHLMHMRAPDGDGVLMVQPERKPPVSKR